MNQKLALENAGDAAIFTITEVREVSTKFGAKICVVGMDDEGQAVETSLISDTTFDNQLGRLDLTRMSVIGERLEFSRAENPKGKPFWNINVPTAGTPIKRMAPAKPAAPVVSGELQPRRDAILSHYLMLWDTVAHHLAQTSTKHGYALDAAAIQAATATIWISWKDRGIQPDAAAPKPAAPPIPTTPPPSGKRLTPEVSVPPENPADDDLPF